MRLSYTSIRYSHVQWRSKCELLLGLYEYQSRKIRRILQNYQTYIFRVASYTHVICTGRILTYPRPKI